MSLNPQLHDWRGKTVWLVGASTGIGRATAALLHKLGATVIVSARQQALLEGFVREHPGSEAIALDVLDATALKAAVVQLRARHARLDLIVYAAGTYRPLSALAFDRALAQQHFDINVGGALNLLDAALPWLLSQAEAGQGGHLSLISSIAASRGLPKALAYGPSKAALTHLAEVLYLDLHPQGLGVSVIHPGFVTTPLTAQNDFKMPAEISAETAARAMLDGWARGHFDIHFPRRFTGFLKVLRWLPDALYFRFVARATR
jgi:NAD(P)-dependent dehydrogenase (short-subunit alcohol dehydrogenase family)